MLSLCWILFTIWDFHNGFSCTILFCFILLLLLCTCSVLALPQPSKYCLQHVYEVQLGKFLNEGDFLPEVKECLRPLISSALSVYRKVLLSLRPTPAKLHYAYSFNDVSKVEILINGVFLFACIWSDSVSFDLFLLICYCINFVALTAMYKVLLFWEHIKFIYLYL